MPVPTTDCAAIKVKLDTANANYLRLMSGGSARVIQDSDGSRIEYATGTAPRLYQYIALLQAQYDQCLRGCGGAAITRPLTFYF